MKKIINGKLYDTDTAKELGRWANMGDQRNFHYMSESLYLKRTGEYFLYGEGGPMSKYVQYISDNEWGGSCKIMPLTVEGAREWAEEHLSADEYEQIFGLPDEDAEPTAIHMMLPAQLAAAARQRAAVDGVTLTRIVEQALTEYLG